jgi:hypothetical protein
MARWAGLGGTGGGQAEGAATMRGKKHTFMVKLEDINLLILQLKIDILLLEKDFLVTNHLSLTCQDSIRDHKLAFLGLYHLQIQTIELAND